MQEFLSPYGPLLLIGIVTGMTTGLTGSSGVAVIVPLISLLLGLEVHQAIAISLIVDILASLVIAYTYYRHGHIKIGSGGWIALGAVLGAQLGAALAVEIPEADLGAYFGLSLIVTGIVMWQRRGKGLAPQLNPDSSWGISHPITEVLIAIGLGLLVGVGTGITGAGGGLMILIILVLLLNFSMHDAIGTSTLIMAITATSGVFGYAFQTDIFVTGGIVAGVGAAFGGIGGATLANHMRERTLIKIVSAFFFVLGVAMTALYGEAIVQLVRAWLG